MKEYVVEILEQYRDARAQFVLWGGSGYTNNLERAGAFELEEAKLVADSYRGQATIRQFVVTDVRVQGLGDFFRDGAFYDRVRRLV